MNEQVNHIQVDRLSTVVSANRPPTQSDKEAAITVVFRDTLNKNNYISVGGGDWEYQSVKGVRDNVYVGTFDKSATATIIDGEYNAAETGIGFGVNTDTPIYRVIEEIQSEDKLFVGTKQLNVSSVSFASSQWTVFGTWSTTFADLTFDASEDIYYSRQQTMVREVIWSGSAGLGNNNNSLNAGKRFSDYSLISFLIHRNYQYYMTTVPREELETTEITQISQGRTAGIDILTDTTWNPVISQYGIAVAKIWGIR